MNDNAKKWVEALKSGDYKQTYGRLHDKKGYCCLGVAVDIYRKETGIDRDLVIDDACLQGGFKCVMDWLDLSCSDGEYGDSSLAKNNDDDGYNFNDIAAIIESEPEYLFNESRREQHGCARR